MWRILEFWTQAAAAVYSLFAFAAIQVIGLGLGAVAGTAYLVIGLRPHLIEKSIYDISFWCPYGVPNVSAVDQLVWTICAFTGWMLALEFLGKVLFTQKIRCDLFDE